MSDEQNIEREAEVEGQSVRVKFKPGQDVEGHASRWGRSNSEAPENTDVSDANATDESEVEGQVKIKFEPTAEVEGQAIKGKRDDSEAPRDTDVTDAEASDESEVEGQTSRFRYEPAAEVEGDSTRVRYEPAAEVEGQGFTYSDETLKQAIQQVEKALSALAKLDAKREPAEVEGQRFVSDENLKQAVEQVKSALAALTAMQAEVEGQATRFNG